MKLIHKKDLMAAALAGVLTFTNAYSQTPAAPGDGSPSTPGFNHKIPEKILTPDTVQTRIGTLKFVDGIPTPETTNTVFDHLDFARGMEVFLNFIPAASIEAVRLGQAELGAAKSNHAVIWDQLADSSQLYLTMNSDTVYTLAVLDLETDGPTVIEVPPGSGPTTVDDAFFRFVVDMGPPDQMRARAGSTSSFPSGSRARSPRT